MPIYTPKVQRVVAEQWDSTRPSLQAIEALPGVRTKVVQDGLFVFIEKRWTLINVGSWVVVSRVAGIEIISDDEFQTLYELAP